MNFYFNEIFNQFSEEDLKEIEQMPIPSLYQAETLVKYWVDCYEGESSSYEAKNFIGKATAKCVQKCKQVYPELFI